MQSDYFVVPLKDRPKIGVGEVYTVVDRKRFVIVAREHGDWLKKLPAALRFTADAKSWGFTAYAKGKEIAARKGKKVTGDVAAVAKLFGIDAAKLETAVAGDVDAFLDTLDVSRYAFTVKSYDEAVQAADGFGELDEMEKFEDFTEPVRVPRAGRKR